MKKSNKVLIASCFVFILPFLLFLGVFSSSESGDSSQFQPATPQEKVALEVSNYVTSHGGTLQFASAWIGNMEHESGLNPARIQSDLAFNPSIAYNASLGGYGIGLGQWDSGRRVNLLNFAKSQKKEWESVALQMDFAWNKDGSDSDLLKECLNQKM